MLRESKICRSNSNILESLLLCNFMLLLLSFLLIYAGASKHHCYCRQVLTIPAPPTYPASGIMTSPETSWECVSQNNLQACFLYCLHYMLTVGFHLATFIIITGKGRKQRRDGKLYKNILPKNITLELSTRNFTKWQFLHRQHLVWELKCSERTEKSKQK